MINWNTLFVQPIQITGIGQLIMLAPLTLCISIVYKTMRCERMSQVPLASLILCLLILLVMGFIGLLLLIVFQLFA